MHKNSICRSNIRYRYTNSIYRWIFYLEILIRSADRILVFSLDLEILARSADQLIDPDIKFSSLDNFLFELKDQTIV